VPLTYPAEAKAQLELPKELSGQILIQQPSGGASWRSSSKLRADRYYSLFQRALFSYAANHGQRDLVGAQCSLELADDQVTTVQSDACPMIPTAPANAKGRRPRSRLTKL